MVIPDTESDSDRTNDVDLFINETLTRQRQPSRKRPSDSSMIDGKFSGPALQDPRRKPTHPTAPRKFSSAPLYEPNFLVRKSDLLWVEQDVVFKNDDFVNIG